MIHNVSISIELIGSGHSEVTRNTLPHSHDFFEMNFLNFGKTKMMIDDQVYSYDSYDLILIPPGMSHILYESTYEKFDNYIIWFNGNMNLFDYEKPIKFHNNDGPVQFLFLEICRLFQSSDMNYTDLLGAYLYALLLHVKNNVNLLDSASQTTDRVEQAVRIINEGILCRQISAGGVARELGLSPAYFARSFRYHTGVAPTKYINDVRIAQAKRMLKGSNSSVQEIAASLHYRDALYFSRQFTKSVGLSPRSYRKSIQSI